ncbi:uncharacterized protein LOC141621435 isoform X2 [Silene latifolia]|uniref:uncharacterized protein LOC141621435 isoform X2 n=1 Tax=Silene latifolia TaxID=37657 RepID=UPI003D7881C1
MGDHLALLVNRLLTESTLHAAIESRNNQAKEVEYEDDDEYLVPKIDIKNVSYPRKMVECRICQDEDLDSNMETPCSCCGSLKYAHRRCVQRWCNEKGDTVCEICHQKFEPGYRAPPPLLKYGRIPVNFRRSWQINRRELALAQLPQTVSSEHSLIISDFEEPCSRSLVFRFAVAAIFIGLLILRHTLPIMVGGSEFVLPLFILAALRIVGILLLVYVTMMAVTGLRRQRNQDVVQDVVASISAMSSDEETEPLDEQQPSHVIQIT